MAKVSGVIPNFINGVSQQPPQLRLPTQAEAQVNGHATALYGLTPRPTSIHLAKLLNSAGANALIHWIDRDEDERYVVVFDANDIRVFDFGGTEKTVAFDAYASGTWSSTPVTDYITTTDPKSDLRALTVADYSVIVNRTKQAGVYRDDPPAQESYEALVNVIAGGYGRTYIIKINGSTAATFTTSATDPLQSDTSYIADQLHDDLVAGGYNSTNWFSTRYQSAIYIQNISADFTISIEDGLNGNAMKVAKDKVQRFSDLPVFGPDGFLIEVAGEDANDFDNYFLRFTKEDDGDSTGVWVETYSRADDTHPYINPTTTPHILVREADGTFTFKEAPWTERTCGSETSAPPPSFVIPATPETGYPISDVFFFKNRLGMMSGENIIMSRSGDFFNLWRGTMLTVADDDPIDIASTHTKVSNLEHALTFDGRLILFGKQSQFELSSDGYLAPTTVSLTPKTDYEIDVACKPVVTGDFIYWGNKRGAFTALYEFERDDSVESYYSATDLTAHAPIFVPNDVTLIEASASADILVALSSANPDTLFVYKSFWSGSEKLQSSWSKWQMPGVVRILSAKVIEAFLYVVVERTGGEVFLEYIPIGAGAVDEGATYFTHLDRKVSSADMAAGSYNAGTGLTTYTLPYSVHADDEDIFVAVSREVVGNAAAPGAEYTISSITGTSIVLTGNTTAVPLWFGHRVESEYTLSPIVIRQDSPNGGMTVISEGRLQLHYLTLEFGNTSFFEVTVSVEDRTTKTYTFSRPTQSATNPLTVESGRFRVPIMAKADTAEIKIRSDSYLPYSILSGEWNGRYIARNQRIA